MTRARRCSAALVCGAMLLLMQSATAEARVDGTRYTWTVVPSPNAGSNANYLTGTAAISSTDVWAVGAEYRQTTSTPAPLTQHWDGTSWSIVRAPSGTQNYNELNAVSATSSGDVWAVGYRLLGAYTKRTFVLHWDGGG